MNRELLSERFLPEALSGGALLCGVGVSTLTLNGGRRETSGVGVGTNKDDSPRPRESDSRLVISGGGMTAPSSVASSPLPSSVSWTACSCGNRSGGGDKSPVEGGLTNASNAIASATLGRKPINGVRFRMLEKC